MQGERLAVFISNDGQTVAPSEQQQLFNPLFRASNASESKGFGVGLSIVKRIAEYHHAEVSYAIDANGNNQFSVVFSD